MFVVNLKLDLKKILIFCVILAAIIAIFVEFNNSYVSSTPSNNSIDVFDYVFNTDNYIELLKNIHDRMDENVNKTVKISGYVFRMTDFKEGYFVVGRNVIVSDDETSLAGFLCYNEDGNSLIENEWIEVTGVIIKGNYNGDIPVLKVNTITKISKPTDSFVRIK